MAKTLTLHRWIDQENLTLDVELVAENPNMIGTCPTSPRLSVPKRGCAGKQDDDPLPATFIADHPTPPDHTPPATR